MNFQMIKTKRRKLTACGMTLVLLLSLTSCKTSLSDTEETEAEPVTFTFYTADGIEDDWSDPVAEAITEATGVSLETSYPSDSSDNGIDLMIATREYTDLIFAKGDGTELIRQGALIDLSDLIDRYGPHIKELYGDEYENLKDEDGHIYQLCSDQVQDGVIDTGGTAQLQWAVIAMNGYEYPTTLDEYTDMIRDYMSKYRKIDGQTTIGISMCVTDWRWYTMLSNPSGYIANGSVDNGQWIVYEDGTAVYKPMADGQKEYYQWLNEMYNTGVLDPEFATQSYDDYLDKIASGRVLGLLDADWSYGQAETTLLSEGKEERTYCGLPITMDSSVTCSALRETNLAIGWGVGISTSCEDPVRAIQFIDYLCSEEGQILIHWGIEDVNYYYDEDGKRCRTEEEITRSETDVDYEIETGVGLHSYPFPCYGNLAKDSTGNYYSVESQESVKANYTEHELAALEAWGVDYLTDIFPQADSFEPLNYSPLWSQTLPDELDTLTESLDAITWRGLINCVVCSPENFDSYWELLQTNLRNAGVARANRLMTEVVEQNIEDRED